jgi:hypothetical protein
VRIWDVASHQQLAELRGYTSVVTSVAFDGSGKFLASGDVAEAWSVLEHVFPPFLACCADAVMLSKRHVAIDDDDGLTATTMRFMRMKLRGGHENILFLITFE